LGNEDRVHTEAFRIFVFATDNKMDRHTAFDMFKAYFANRPKLFWKSSEFDLPMKGAFMGYWALAISKSYWNPAQLRTVGGWLPFQKTLEQWRQIESTLIDNWQSELEAWRMDN
jgi:hypothetical protein